MSRGIAGITPARLALLNGGSVASATLTEGLAVDFAQLLAAAVPDLGAVRLERMRAHLDLTLPVVDLGCGNGRQTRALASSFPLAIGVDLAGLWEEAARAHLGFYDRLLGP